MTPTVPDRPEPRDFESWLAQYYESKEYSQLSWEQSLSLRLQVDTLKQANPDTLRVLLVQCIHLNLVQQAQIRAMANALNRHNVSPAEVLRNLNAPGDRGSGRLGGP